MQTRTFRLCLISAVVVAALGALELARLQHIESRNRALAELADHRDFIDLAGILTEYYRQRGELPAALSGLLDGYLNPPTGHVLATDRLERQGKPPIIYVYIDPTHAVIVLNDQYIVLFPPKNPAADNNDGVPHAERRRGLRWRWSGDLHEHPRVPGT